MWEAKDILLKVAKAYPNDSARGIARLDPNALLTLRLSPGDIIEIEGKRTTVAKVWRADRQDWSQDYIRIDGFIRQNAGVGIGDKGGRGGTGGRDNADNKTNKLRAYRE